MSQSIPSPAIDIQPAALMVTAAGDTPLAELNTALAAHSLCLPIFPLEGDLTLADLVARNAGGRRQLRYGTVVRYLRAATLTAPGQASLVCGGPTLKRATGYVLQRALVGRQLPIGLGLHDLTLNLRPLPPARAAQRIVCADLAAACNLAHGLLAAGLALSALGVLCADLDQPAVLLAELEDQPAVLQRQAAQVAELAQAAGAAAVSIAADAAWCEWETQANRDPVGVSVDLTLPRVALASFVAQVAGLTRRYNLSCNTWGDAGVGRLHFILAPAAGVYLARGEIEQAGRVIAALARRLGGAPTTERTPDPAATLLTAGLYLQDWDSVRVLPGAPATCDQADLLAELRAVVGNPYVLTNPDDLGCYAKDGSIARAAGQPLAVVLPRNTAEVSAVMRLAAVHGLPVVTRGAGSGLAGGSTPSPGALVLSLTRMEDCRVDAHQMTAQVAAGTVTADLQRAAEAAGLLYPPDPSSLTVSTIGGNIACNAGGPRCLKYGVTADYVLGLTAVLADGSVVQLGDGLTGQSPDAGLMQLLIGSEGTLAVITEASLRLIRQPAARRTALAMFDQLDDACATVERIMAAGLIPAGLELMDDTTINVVEDYLQIGLPRDAGALLLLLADGEPETVAIEAEMLADLARQGGASRVAVARNPAEEADLWKARRSIAPALARVRPNRLGEDISVPLPQIANCVRRIKQVAATYQQPIVVFGHAGDGNLHPNILFDSRDPVQVERVWQAAEAVFQVALDLGGTLSGEHGIGTLKRPFMAAALGSAVLDFQRSIKAQFDPAGLLNPNKVLP